MKPALFFRFDASPEIGAGHLRRCLTLARECLRKGAVVHLMGRTGGLDAIEMGDLSGMTLHRVPWEMEPVAEARWLVELCQKHHLRCGVVDHYRQDENYQNELMSGGVSWMQFGNPAHNHPLLGHLLHDARPGAVAEDYAGRLPLPQTRLLFGPRFALLNPAFALEREKMKAEPETEVTRVLLTFGGGHDGGAMVRAMDWLAGAGYEGAVEVLTTRLNPNLRQIEEKAAANPQVRLHLDNWSPAPVMAGCQLALTAGGTTLHELACLGVPALVVCLAENQRAPAVSWQAAGLGASLGDLSGIDDAVACVEVRRWIEDTAMRRAVALCCLECQDGKGAQRTAQALLELVAAD